jgi:hypothetical protein
MTRKAISSEGRGLRARIARPNSCQGISLPRGGWPGAPGLPGTCLGQTGALLRACGARPSQGWTIQARMALPGGRPGDDAKGGFLGGARSPRPHCKAELAPRHSISTTCVNDGTRPNGDMLRASPSIFYRACRARPSAGVAHPS